MGREDHERGGRLDRRVIARRTLREGVQEAPRNRQSATAILEHGLSSALAGGHTLHEIAAVIVDEIHTQEIRIQTEIQKGKS